MDDLLALQDQIKELSYLDNSFPTTLTASQREVYCDLVSGDVKNLSWVRSISLRGGKANVYYSLMNALIHAKRTVGIDPITIFIIIKLIIELLIFLRHEFGEVELRKLGYEF